MSSTIRRTLFSVAMLACVTGIASAQTTTSTQTRTFEIIAVDGNQLVVKGPEGTREITVPSDFRFTVDGKSLSVQQLKPGMSGTAAITRTTTVTPVTATEVKNGTVAQVSGASIIVRTDEGFKMFSQSDVDKRRVKIMRNGEPATVSDFRSGDRLSAVIITSLPPKVVTETEVNALLATSGSGGSAAAPGSAAAGSAAAPTRATGTSPSAASGGGATASGGRTLPKTASPLPLLALLGGLSLVAGVGLTLRRRFVARG